MRKLIIGFLALASVLLSVNTKAAEEKQVADKTVQVEKKEAKSEAKPEIKSTLDVEKEQVSLHQFVKEKIIEGGVTFMSIVLICLIIGLTIAVERVVTLNMATSNVSKFMEKVKESFQTNGIDKTKELCASTRGPIPSILAQGLLRIDEGVDNVEKSIDSYGSTEMIRLEKGMSWIQLFINLAPMFGFMGTVMGMIEAFDQIQATADIQIDQVAGGIKVALLTTVAGLVVAVILQVFYNYLSAKLDSISEQMEDANNSFVDMLVVAKKMVPKS